VQQVESLQPAKLKARLLVGRWKARISVCWQWSKVLECRLHFPPSCSWQLTLS